MPVRPQPRNDLLGLAATQVGVFSAEQARALGFSRQLQHHYIATGQWERLQRGVFRLSAWPHDPNEAVVRWCLWGGPEAVVSHASAARIHGLGPIQDYAVHLTVPVGFGRRPPNAGVPPGVILHRGRIPPEDVEVVHGARVTRPLRTLLDLAEAGVDGAYLALAIRAATHRDLVNPSALAARTPSLSATGQLALLQARDQHTEGIV